ncbi:MAG TPA: twin-arginine translocase subunit TatC [Alcanivoracaceae bacterium]|nr:twin-arginine translocase subunit TatC [Alcanivoracaceae bacterium]
MNERVTTEHPQTLITHLLELRSRILRTLIVVGVLFLCLFYFSRDLYTFIAKPLVEAMPAGSTMIATEVASPFLVPFKLTLYVSIFIAVPYILHQAWAFIAPGLYRQEKRLAVPLLTSSIVLFYLGTAFAYFAVFPLIFAFFTSVAPEGVAVATDISSYLDFVMKLFLAFGVAFELPIAIILMVWSGATTTASLSAKRPYIILGCFVAGMFLTPPDVFSQTLLALPMWALFEVGLLCSRWISPKETQAENA